MKTRLIRGGAGDLLTVPSLATPSRVENGFRITHDASVRYSSAQPAKHASILRSQPEFFRFVTPAIYCGSKLGKAYRFADSPELRRVCADDTEWAMRTFSPRVSLERAHEIAVPDMPLVREALEHVSDDHFAGYQLIAVQHLYASTAGMLDALADCGLEHRNMTVIGKAYSACYDVAKTLINRGVRVPVDQLDQSAVESHDDLMAKTVRQELQRYRDGLANGTAPPKLLALDEGGHIVQLLHTEFRDLLPRVTAVEQTRRGIFKANTLAALECTLVDVSSGDLKVDNETPLIARSLFYETCRKRDHLVQCGFKTPKEISIMGLGNIGMATAEMFAKLGWKVRAYDAADIDATVLPKGVELITDRTEFLRGAHVLMPITGQRPISVADYDLLPNRALVMNGASSNDEVAAFEAIERARVEQPACPWWSKSWSNKADYVHGMPDLLADREYLLPATGWMWGELAGTILPLGHASRRGQRDRVLHFADKDIYLAKSGFVLNLTDDPDPIPAKYIQVTRAALALACAQAVTATNERCKVELDPKRSKALHQSYRRLVGNPWEAEWRPAWQDMSQPVKSYSSLLRSTAFKESIGTTKLMATGRIWQAGDPAGVRVRLSPQHILPMARATQILRSR